MEESVYNLKIETIEELNKKIKRLENKIWPDGNRKRLLHYTEEYDKDILDLLYQIRSRKIKEE
tara:strand:+ start:588 stop:776 length:189 start_codon:yes stop_codon:yes gene_type:complete